MKTKSLLFAVTALASCVIATASYAEVVKLAHIDPFSGPAAGLNKNFDNTLRFTVDIVNRDKLAGPDVTFEVVDFDNKNNSQEALLQLKSAQDQGIRYLFQGLSSSIALALIEATNRYNERNPGKEMLFINPSSQAAELTNDKCSFWYFNFDANTDARAAALSTVIAKDKSIKKVYLINQNYALGQQTSASVQKVLKEKRPDIEIVGDDLHPMLQVKDFTPYVTKIRSSGADIVITASFSADLTLLVKAMKEGGVKTPLYTYNAHTTGIPTALAAAGAENVKLVNYWVPNDDVAGSKALIEDFRAKYNDDLTLPNWYNAVRMLAEAMKRAKSTDPVAVAKAMEGLKMTGLGGELTMRKDNHNVQQQMLIADWAKVDGKDVIFDLEKTGYGFKVVERISPEAASVPTTCQMKRPS